MIKLRLVRLKRRSGARPQTGTDQSIYRVLCIAMLPNEPIQEDGKAPLYNAGQVASVGFNPDALQMLYSEHKNGLYQWARSKNLHTFPDNERDKRGKLIGPCRWNKKNWQDRVADLLWNSAADIIDEACDMNERDGLPGDSYWYSVGRGVYRVRAKESQANLERVRALHAIITEAKQQGQVITEEQAVADLESKRGTEPQASKKRQELNPWSIGRMMSRFRWWMAFALVVAGACGTPPVRNAFDVLYKEGIGAAQKIVYSFDPKTPEELFQQAGVDYRSGDYEAASRKAYTILSQEGITDHLRANCWYLLGSIDLSTGANEAALVNYQKANSIYESYLDLQNLYYLSLDMAKSLIFQGDLAAAEEALQTAMNHYKTDGGQYISHLGEYYAAKIDLETAKHDTVAALHFALLRFEEIRTGEEQDQIAGAKSDLGFWYAANGCVSKAELFTFQAGNIIFRLQDEKRHVENLINWILIQRIQGEEADLQTVDSISQWARIRKDSRVEFFLELALSLEPTKEYADELCNQDPAPK